MTLPAIIDAMEAAARDAPPGPWYRRDVDVTGPGVSYEHIVDAAGDTIVSRDSVGYGSRTYAHIAASNPQAVLALIAWAGAMEAALKPFADAAPADADDEDAADSIADINWRPSVQTLTIGHLIRARDILTKDTPNG